MPPEPPVLGPHAVPRSTASPAATTNKIRAHQERAHPGRAVATSLGSMDLAAFAKACGARGIRVDGAAEVDAAIGAAVSHSGVTLVHVLTDPRVVSVDRVLERAD